MRQEEYGRMFAVEERHWWYRSLHELILEAVDEEFRSKGPLVMLDAGCGTGRLLQLLSAYGESEGIDSSDQAVSFCRERGLTRVTVKDLTTANLGEGRYDVITSIDVLYHRHVTDEKMVLERFAKALRPGGIVILQVPALEFLRSSHDEAVFTRRRYCRGEIAGLLKDAGLIIERATYRVGLLFPLLAAYRLISKRLPLRGSDRQAPSDAWMPPGPINRILLAVMRFENMLLRHVRLPVGLSVYAIARKPGHR
ncbi:MAG: class I SAM-dependent methyltransferase [Nitrospirota bacterium]|nr:class I SAM-dependent methyltransferase [Nitrospirota bacterium]